MSFTFIIPPLIGGIIGYITNAVAIKMLFRPRHEVRVFGRRLPFTPGLIPREQARVARSIGSVISTQLLNTETLSEVLTSEEMTSKIRGGIEGLIERNKNNPARLEDILLWFAPKTSADKAIARIKDEAARAVYDRVTGENARAAIIAGISDKIKQKLDGMGLGILDKIAEPVARGVGESINKTIAENGKNIIERLLGSEIDKLKQKRICDLLNNYSGDLPDVTNFAMDIYLRVVREHLGAILADINIAKIVEDRVASFDVAQLESMIFGIMKRELNAIVYLGALLGFIMGWFNLLIKF